MESTNRDEDIVRFRHDGGGHTRAETARRFGISEEEVERVLWSTEPLVYPWVRLDPTAEDIVAARDGDLPKSRLVPGEHPRLRWDRIAARAGIRTGKARRLYDGAKGEGASRRSYTGRGRRFEGME